MIEAEFIPNPNFPRELREWLKRKLYDIANEALPEIKRLAPKDTGQLRERIRVERRGREVVIVMPEYGWYQERGTGVHGPYEQRIYPVKASVLAWRVRAKDKRFGKYPDKEVGDWVFAKSVEGVRARHFVERGLKTYLRAKLGLRRG